MNGTGNPGFTLQNIPKCVKDLLALAGIGMEEVDLFVFHQADQYMLEHLRKQSRDPWTSS